MPYRHQIGAEGAYGSGSMTGLNGVMFAEGSTGVHCAQRHSHVTDVRSHLVRHGSGSTIAALLVKEMMRSHMLRGDPIKYRAIV